MQLEDEFNQLCLLLEQSLKVRRMLNACAREITGLTLEQASVLCRIEQNGLNIPTTKLAQKLSRASHTLTPMLDNLEQKGLVYRSRNPKGQDRRQVLVGCSPDGLRQLQIFRERIGDCLRPLLVNAPRDFAERLRDAVQLLECLPPD